MDGTAINGGIHVELDGTGIAQSVRIAEDVLRSHPQSEVEAGLVEAFNTAVQKAKQLHLDGIESVVKDLGIPGVDSIIKSLAE